MEYLTLQLPLGSPGGRVAVMSKSLGVGLAMWGSQHSPFPPVLEPLQEVIGSYSGKTLQEILSATVLCVDVETSAQREIVTCLRLHSR